MLNKMNVDKVVESLKEENKNSQQNLPTGAAATPQLAQSQKLVQEQAQVKAERPRSKPPTLLQQNHLVPMLLIKD